MEETGSRGLPTNALLTGDVQFPGRPVKAGICPVPVEYKIESQELSVYFGLFL